MASLTTDSRGFKRIMFYPDGPRGPRPTIHLGKVSIKSAQSFKIKVEALVAAHAMHDPVDRETAAWVAGLSDTMHAKLAKVGLVQEREKRDDTLAGLIDRFTKQADVKPGTKAAYRQTTKSLLDYFGGNTLVCKITESDADRWRQSLVESKLAPATVAKRCYVAKNIFKKAARWGMIDTTPFADLRTGSQVNSKRNIYVSRETIAKVLDACPDPHWRAVVALSRYAGLRCPSEHVMLRWSDIHWGEHPRMVVHSPKTERHAGHDSRVVPVCPRLGRILLDLFEQAPEGEDRVLPKLANASANLRTTFLKIIERAGEKPWPRLFQNLRASCATDWVEKVPNHVAASWLGHSPMVAATHYLKTRDAHFDIITREERGGAESGAFSAQYPTRHGAAQKDTDGQHFQKGLENKAILPVSDRRRLSVQNQIVGGEGFEPPKA